jgi:hypothetical protein
MNRMSVIAGLVDGAILPESNILSKYSQSVFFAVGESE